jgi:hypothetical protein
LLATPQDQLTRWQEYVKNNLAARPPKVCIITTQKTPNTTKIPSGAPTGKEIKTAIKHLKLNKASGLDNPATEIFKTYQYTIANIVEPLLKKYGIPNRSQMNGNKGSSKNSQRRVI